MRLAQPTLKENYTVMDQKSMMRKKAMESMMKEGPSIAIKIAKKGMEEEMPEQAKEGFVSMMVSPEEKQMIMEMREGKGSEEVEGQSPEMDIA